MRARALVLLLVLLAACASEGGETMPDVTTGPDTIAVNDTVADAAADVPPAPAPRLWPENELPALSGPFHDAHPELAPWSRWRTHLDHTAGPVPDFRGRGAFGVGNGRVFGVIGLADPANTLHNLAGPNYEQGENFFADIHVRLEAPDAQDGQSWDEEWVLTSFGAPALLWRGRRGALEMDIVDLTPWPVDGAGEVPPIQRSYLRTVLVRNTGETALNDLVLVVQSYRSLANEVGDALAESRGNRHLLSFLDREEAVAEGQRLAWALPALAPGEEQRVQIFHMSYWAGADAGAERAAVLDEDIDALFSQSAAALQDWWAEGLVLESPDPMVNDLARALALMIKVQVSAGGATTPMSNYAGTWTRDNIGPVFGALAMGFHEDAAGMLDYYYRAVLDAGGLRNRYRCDLDPSQPMPPALNWDAMGEGSGRTQAEAPSYVPIMYGRYADWTGDLTRASERLDFLHYTIRSLVVSEDGLLSWSGDETFRTAMNAAMGLPLEYDHHELTWSSNSCLLFSAGARAVARFARLAGEAAIAEAMEQEAAFVDEGALAHLRLPDGCWAAYAMIDTGELSPGAFEDAALTELWAGARDGDDPAAAARLACLVERVGAAPGILQSPLHPSHAGFPLLPGIEGGIYTGMLPGYTLDAYARAGHFDGEAAFDALRLSADSSGNYTEYMIFEGHAPLQFIYNAEGSGRTDYTARFRPWEGGIVLHAMLGYLVGLRPQALADHLVLRPHLPNDWPAVRYEGLRVAGARFDLALTRQADGGVEIQLQSHAERPFTVDLRWDHPAGETWTLDAEGGELLVHEGPFLPSVERRGLPLPAGATLRLRAHR